MEKEKVSIIVPVFNAQKTLKRCVESLVTQTYQNVEIVLVDDGSTDNSPSICDELALSDKRIRVIHKTNGDISSARNAGLEVCTGTLVEFVDSDDFLENDCVEKLVEGLKGADLCVCGYFRHSNKIAKICFDKSEIDDFRNRPNVCFDFVKNSLVNTIWNKLFKKELITENFNPRYFIGEDVIFNLKYLLNCKKVSVIDKILYHYDFTNINSTMHTRVREKVDFDAYWQEIYDFAEKFFVDKSYLKQLNGMHIRTVMLQIMNTCIKKKSSYKEFKKIFKIYRFAPQTLEALKNYDRNFLKNDRIFGKILCLVFKWKIYCAFFFAMRFYNWWHYRKTKRP